MSINSTIGLTINKKQENFLSLDSISKKIEQELNTVKKRIREYLQTHANKIIQRIHVHNITYIGDMFSHLFTNEGKYLRPILCLLCGSRVKNNNKLIDLAVIVEILHIATLVHDDVIDQSQMRRHNKTLNAMWDNRASVLIGDYLHALSFQLINQLSNLEINSILANATTEIIGGELLQLYFCNNLQTTENDYIEIIGGKTASLFSVTTHAAGIIGEHNQETQQRLKIFGYNFGIAYQLLDDLIDYCGNSEEMGKNIGDDLAEGKTTLPLIYALNNTNGSDHDIIKSAISNGEIENITFICQILNSCGAIDYTKSILYKYLNLAKQEINLISSETIIYKEQLLLLLDYIKIKTP